MDLQVRTISTSKEDFVEIYTFQFNIALDLLKKYLATGNITLARTGCQQAVATLGDYAKSIINGQAYLPPELPFFIKLRPRQNTTNMESLDELIEMQKAAFQAGAAPTRTKVGAIVEYIEDLNRCLNIER